MTALKWEDPPPRSPRRRNNTTTRLISDELIARPGEWARIRDYKGSDRAAAHCFATTIRRARTPSFEPKGAFESAVRRVGDVYAVYARYVGEGTS